ncbi:unnamed protein product [Boreogadus saida]
MDWRQSGLREEEEEEEVEEEAGDGWRHRWRRGRHASTSDPCLFLLVTSTEGGEHHIMTAGLPSEARRSIAAPHPPHRYQATPCDSSWRQWRGTGAREGVNNGGKNRMGSHTGITLMVVLQLNEIVV